MKITPSKITINPIPIKTSQIYNLHQGFKNEQKVLIKAFTPNSLIKFNLQQTILANIQLLSEYFHQAKYPQNLVNIEDFDMGSEEKKILTQCYQCRLDQYIREKGALMEKNVLEIFQDVYKAVWSTFELNFIHKNYRAQHFVKIGNKWKLQSFIQEVQIPENKNQNNNENENENKIKLQSQYIRKVNYQPPQAYFRDKFSQKEIAERMVWDLGCILIHLLTGEHKLTSLNVLDKFQNRPFSFQSIGQQNIGSNISTQLKNMLGLMCHYNHQKRIKFMQLKSSGFFCRQLGSVPKNKHKQQAGDNININKNKPNPKNIQNSIIQIIIKDEQKQYIIFGEDKKPIIVESDSKIKQREREREKERQRQKLKQEQKQRQNLKLLNFRDIQNQQYHSIIEAIKNQLEKGEILTLAAGKFQDVVKLHDGQNQNQVNVQQLVQLSLFAVYFVNCMDLNKLAIAMRENKCYNDFSKWPAFKQTKQYTALVKIIDNKLQTAILQLTNQKHKIHQKQASTLPSPSLSLQKKQLKQFLESNPPYNPHQNQNQKQFKDIKQPYRHVTPPLSQILTQLYKLVSKIYKKDHKKIQLAQLGIYVTFCLAVDKFYMPGQMQTNFQYVFKWCNKVPCNVVTVKEFQYYVEHANKEDLLNNSRYIVQRYYSI